MPLPDFLSTSNTFRQWLATTNNLISHVDNTSVYILVSQNATPRVATGNISVNGTITLGATTLNTTAYTGTATNATNLNSQPGSFYTNASNLGTGTLPIARLDANVLLTTSTTGINASALSTGTVPLARLTSANSSANGVVDTTTQTFAGNKTFDNNVAIIGYLTVGNSTITLNSTTLVLGNASSNLVLNSSSVMLDGSQIINSSGAANNASNLNGQPATYYTNASNISSGTLAIDRLDANVLLTTSTTGINASALSTGTVPNARLDSNIIFTTSTTGINASALSTGTVPDGRLSGAYTGVTSLSLGANVVANVTTVFVGNSTANVSHTATSVSVANSTNTATLTPISLSIGLQVVNTAGVFSNSALVIPVGLNKYAT